MSLDDDSEALAYELAFASEGLEQPECPIEQFSELCIEAAGKFRALAIILLLSRGETDLFYHNLIRSGRIRLHYLQRMYDAGRLDDHHFAAGRFESLLDAVAAGERDLARDIAALSLKELRRGHEYEDDFCFAQIIGNLVTAGPEAHRASDLFVDRFAEFAAGEPAPRLDVCRALLARDQKELDPAFSDLLVARQDQIRDDRQRGQLEDVVVLANRHVFIEGLALLRIAEDIGLETSREYEFCPSLARVPMVTPFPGE